MSMSLAFFSNSDYVQFEQLVPSRSERLITEVSRDEWLSALPWTVKGSRFWSYTFSGMYWYPAPSSGCLRGVVS